jgi:sulfite exporter TauE/SafE
MLANCLHSLTAIGVDGLATVAGALFLAGLAGGFTHCAGMCAPFVLAQAGARADRSAGGGVFQRLAGAALLPYHAGRMLGYALLGALAGGTAGLLSELSGVRYLLAALLLAAAILMILQATARLPPRWRPRLPGGAAPLGAGLAEALARRVGPLLVAPTGGRGVLLGLLLSALPCGLLYAALAGAAATGSALAGAIAMAAFVAGTIPALFGVALLGRFFLRGQGAMTQAVAVGLFALNGVVLGAMAWRLAV